MKKFSTFWPLLLTLGPVVAQTTPMLTNASTTLTVASGAVLYVEGGVQNANGATLTNAGTVQLTGDLTNAGTLTSSGTLLFSGTTDQTLTPGTASVTALTLNNLGALNSNRLFIPADLTVTGTLTLTKGLIRTQGSNASSPLATLSLPDGGRVVGEGTGQYVQGRLAVTRTTVTAGMVDFTNGALINPNGQSLGPVTVTRTAGLQQAGVSYGTNVGGTNKGIDRVWQVAAAQQPNPATPASITLNWVSDDDNGFTTTTPAQLWRADQASGPWAMQGAPASISTRSFTANVTQLGALTVSNTSAPLPITLVSFTAVAKGEDALLRWTTASEHNNDHFEVEASADGHTFARIGTVAGHGTTSQAHDYQLLDKNIAHYGADPVYYRLRQVDLDGTATYSPVRTVRVAEEFFAMEAYPSPLPVGQGLNLLVHTPTVGAAMLQVRDALGRLLLQRAVELPVGTTSVELPEAAHWAAGMYLLRVQQGTQQQMSKVVRE